MSTVTADSESVQSIEEVQGVFCVNPGSPTVKAIAMMEAVLAPAFPTTFEAMSPEIAEFFQTMRTEGMGEESILNQNMFVEQVLPGNVIRGLGPDEMAHYRAPYPDAASRTPVRA